MLVSSAVRNADSADCPAMSTVLWSARCLSRQGWWQQPLCIVASVKVNTFRISRRSAPPRPPKIWRGEIGKIIQRPNKSVFFYFGYRQTRGGRCCVSGPGFSTPKKWFSIFRDAPHVRSRPYQSRTFLSLFVSLWLSRNTLFQLFCGVFTKFYKCLHHSQHACSSRVFRFLCEFSFSFKHWIFAISILFSDQSRCFFS